MMPHRQVFYRRCLLGRCIKQSRPQIENHLETFINERIGALLERERLTVGKTIETVASSTGVTQSELESWEKGVSSPPVYAYSEIINFYGAGAYARAANLDLEMQIEKSRRLESQRDKQCNTVNVGAEK
jgi:transcriptional regulator with XRE-family HTH domain